MEINSTSGSNRVVLANRSRLLREMLRRAIVKSPHLQVVGEVTDGKDLVSTVEKFDAQWVILSLTPEGEVPQVANKLLNAYPPVAILAVASDGSEVRVGWTEPREKAIAKSSHNGPVKLRWTEPHEKLLEDFSLEKLIGVLRKGTLWEQTLEDYREE